MDRKCVMIVDKNLPLGLIANTTAIRQVRRGNRWD